jgi:hypothetical protein
MRRKILWFMPVIMLTAMLLLIPSSHAFADTSPYSRMTQVPDAAVQDATQEQAIAGQATKDAAIAEQAKFVAEQDATNKQTTAKAAIANATVADALYIQQPNPNTLANKMAADAAVSVAVQQSRQASALATQKEQDATTAENNANQARAAAAFANSMAATAMKNGVGCFATSCNHQDAQMSHCNLSQMVFVPITLRDDAGDIIATGRGIYSVACKANWIEGTLTSLGKNLILNTQTTDEQGNQQTTAFLCPDRSASCAPTGYNGATGWPAASDMLDGTNAVAGQLIATGPDGKTYKAIIASL